MLKKRLTGIIIILVLIALSACNASDKSIAIKNGTYYYEQSGEEQGFSPYVTISDHDIIFSYDALSSYMPIGTYTVEDNILTMRTDDKNYTYVFQLKKDQLVFLKDDSSALTLIDHKTGIEITDHAEFNLEDN